MSDEFDCVHDRPAHFYSCGRCGAPPLGWDAEARAYREQTPAERATAAEWLRERLEKLHAELDGGLCICLACMVQQREESRR